MNVQRMRWRWAVGAALLVVWVAHSGQAVQCVVCRQPIRDAFVWMSHPTLDERQPVCAPCAALETVCFTCRLPVKLYGLKLDDGRWLCPLHAREAVLTQRDALEVFTETQRELFRLLRGCGELPDRNVTVLLVDQPRLERLARETAAGDEPSATLGLTHSRREGDRFAHTIHLLGGLGRRQLMAVSAHEYAHAWLHENLPANRGLDRDTTEGFCELVAYKLASDLGHEAEKRLILTNAYTRGQTAVFIQAQEAHCFYRVVQWIRSGVGERLESTHSAPILALGPEPVAAPALPEWLPSVKTAVPHTLRLKGVSGRPGHWLALINNETLAAGETARVRVGTSNVTVRCLAVTEISAEIELPPTGERRVLLLSGR